MSRNNRPSRGEGRNKKETALGCGCLGLLSLLVIGGIGAAFDDGDSSKKDDKPTTVVAKSGSPSTSPSASPTPAHTTASPAAPKTSAPTVVKVKLPDFTGRGLQDAQDAAQELGLYRLRSHDLTGHGRFQVWDRNWRVCSQDPSPGRVDEDSTITFNVVKNDESCSYRADASTGGTDDEDGSSSSTSGGGTSSGGTSSGGSSSSSSGGSSSSSSGGSSSSSSGGSSSSSTGGSSSGATALCNDGSYSYAAHHQGACSHHGGVAVFYR
ncbi:DUF3761 domain-containing protein [Streptomyces iranensis]|uniref:DUF3761 domain-containing protein n=1 Tax=Streptomyces iranensis TaxID=576784 RepID=UPI0039B75DFA